MKNRFCIFGAIFSAGVVSLVLELSLLREFTYVFGSTATSNAIVISVFLGGLVLGSYLGAWKRFRTHGEDDARLKFSILQMVNVLFVLVFYLSKKYFIYDCPVRALVTVYFVVSVLVPSVVAGVSYALSVRIIHHLGPSLTTHIYAYSTLGSVVGGIAHGLILVPNFGMQSTYLCSVVMSAVAAFLMHWRLRWPLRIAYLLLIGAVVWVIAFRPFHGLFNAKDVLFSEDSQFGIVEVWRVDPWQAAYNEAMLRGLDRPALLQGETIDIRINGIHQSYNTPADKEIHEAWAHTSLEIIDRTSDVLLLGYGSGMTAAAFLESPQLRHMDIIENCMPSMTAARRYFPDVYETVLRDDRARLIIDDFRGFTRFTERKYDIVILDLYITDPYQIGFFTLEFFEQIKKVLRPDGVVLLLGRGLSWNTTMLSFKHLYASVDPTVILWVRKSILYMSQEQFGDHVADKYAAVPVGQQPDEPVYTDASVRRLTMAERKQVGFVN